ncbi:MAG: nodulation protein NfeD [Thermomicrobiales bacterium]|nr:nodulation protein NfeD [Thermomicrobiales bacterium]
MPMRFTLAIAFLALSVISLIPASFSAAQDGSTPVVYVIPITGTIDLGLAPFLERVIGEAEDAGAAAIILDIDTPGGRLDAVIQMKDSILGSDVPTVGFVNRTAFSAGALIALATDRIFMTNGGVMGAATPIDGSTGETSSEKTISAVRSTFRSTAEATGRDPDVAAAMVDPNVDIPGLSPAGQLLTLTTNDALRVGYAEAVASSRDDLLAQLGLSGARIVSPDMSLAERTTRFITDPLVAGLLLSVGLLLIVFDFFADGLGIAALAGLAMIAVFFWGHMVAGLAGWEDVVLVAIGLALIAIELFVIPGFGIPGLLGLVALLGGLFLAMLEGEETRSSDSIERALITVLAVVAFVVIGFILLLSFLPRRSRFGGTVLRSTVTDGPEGTYRAPVGWLKWFGGNDTMEGMLATASAPVSTTPADFTGKTGVTRTPLRPSGTAEIDGEPVDVVAEAEFIDQGAPIVVVLDQGYRRVVRRVTADS